MDNNIENLYYEIKSFLNFPDSFWNYISSRIIYVDSTIDGNYLFYNTLMKFDNYNKLIDIKVFVPYIIDLDTALVNIHELKHAYDLYLKLGEYIDNNIDEFERLAINKEKEFLNLYNNRR